MFINKLNQVYKPKRVLYYVEATEQDIFDSKLGLYPESIQPLAGAFGTYDIPGIFYIKSLDKPVIGIEYRLDDARIDYPKGLSSVVLDDTFFYTTEIEYSNEVDLEYIRNIFFNIAEDKDAIRNSSELAINTDSDAVEMFSSDNGKKLRIMNECDLINDKADAILSDDIDRVDKDMLFRLAFHDYITGHYNWNHMIPALEMPIDIGVEDYAFVHFDVKEFKILNEVYGHILANHVLSRIVDAMNKADFVYLSCRCHNDNFAMMIKDMPEGEMIATLRDFFEGLSHLPEDPNYIIYFRAGVVPMQRAILSGNRVADAAKTAQALGRNPGQTDIVIYSDKMHEDVMWSNYIKAYLDKAIENDEFEVHLQPKIDIRNNHIAGAEALVRWNYKSKEMLSPARFVPFFEKDGSIAKVDDIVLRKVCIALDRWKKEGRKLYPISVNLSRTRLYDKNLINRLTEIVDSYNVPHEFIDFELTESATYDNTAYLLSVLYELKNRGFKISMDDFGTGYSSLSLLTEMPLDILKIDKSFVDKIVEGEEMQQDVIVIKSIISLAKELDFVCLAEGAEKKYQVERLEELGCSLIQGYYYSMPIRIEDYEERYL